MVQVLGTYGGDTNYSSASATTGLLVTPQPTSIVVTANPAHAYLGQAISYTATVVPGTVVGSVPTGSVTFSTGSQVLCSALLVSGATSCTAPTTPAGVDTVTASYGGDPDDQASSGTTSVTVYGHVLCTKASGTSSGLLKFTTCAPTSKTNKTASATGSLLSGGGTLSWGAKGGTTIVSVTSTQVGQGTCKIHSTEVVATGVVTGGTSSYTAVGDPVLLSVCETATGKVSLAPGARAAF